MTDGDAPDARSSFIGSSTTTSPSAAQQSPFYGLSSALPCKMSSVRWLILNASMRSSATALNVRRYRRRSKSTLRINAKRDVPAAESLTSNGWRSSEMRSSG